MNKVINNLSSQIDTILKEDDLYVSLDNSKLFLSHLKEKIYDSETYRYIIKFCCDLIYEKCCFIEDIDKKAYYEDIFSNMALYFFKKYEEINIADIYNNQKDINLVFSIAALCIIVGKFDEYYNIIDKALLFTDNNAIKLRILINLIGFGDLDKELLNNYKTLKKILINKYCKDSSSNEYICPVCGFDKLDEPTYYHCNNEVVGSGLNCPCCGFEFNDFNYKNLGEISLRERKKWISNGCNFFLNHKKPKDWNPDNQLKNLSSKNLLH